MITLQISYISQVQPPHSFNWKQRRDMPIATNDARSILIDGKVYIGGGFTNREENKYIIQVYDLEGDEWSQLPRCPVRYSGMTAVNDRLVLAGGCYSDNEASNQIRVWDGWSWTTPYAPMPTARFSTTAVGYQQFLVLVGGSDSIYSSIIEILDTVTEQWHTATPLPVGCKQLTSALVGDTLYLLGGFSGVDTPNKRVFGISLPTLIAHAAIKWKFLSRVPAPTWDVLPDAPLKGSTAISLNNSLLAVGGEDIRKNHSSAIHLYNSQAKKWLKVGDLPATGCQCTCTTLPSGELLILGGGNENGKYSNKVYVATVNK